MINFTYDLLTLTHTFATSFARTHIPCSVAEISMAFNDVSVIRVNAFVAGSFIRSPCFLFTLTLVRTPHTHAVLDAFIEPFRCLLFQSHRVFFSFSSPMLWGFMMTKTRRFCKKQIPLKSTAIFFFPLKRIHFYGALVVNVAPGRKINRTVFGRKTARYSCTLTSLPLLMAESDLFVQFPNRYFIASSGS